MKEVKQLILAKIKAIEKEREIAVSEKDFTTAAHCRSRISSFDEILKLIADVEEGRV